MGTEKIKRRWKKEEKKRRWIKEGNKLEKERKRGGVKKKDGKRKKMERKNLIYELRTCAKSGLH